MKNHLPNQFISRVLKMSRYFLLIVILQALSASLLLASESRGQGTSVYDTPIALSPKTTTLTKIFKQIESETDFNFSYHSRVFDDKTEVTVGEESSLGELLEMISEQTGLKFKRVDNNIHVVKRVGGDLSVVEENLEDSVQQNSISGQVHDENGESMPGVTIQVKGTTTGTITDIEGKFKLNVPEDAVIVASFVGYKAQEIAVNGRAILDISMELDVTSLDEVVVVGYGAVKKSDLTGSVVKVKDEDLKAIPTTNALEALQGKVTGMDLTRQSGESGAGLDIRIRGTRSLTADNGPLILVDGMPYGNNLDIPPSEIESIEILKDASSTAIYGSRGANGVILITTKRGKSGQARISFNSYAGTNKIYGYPDFTLGEEWVEMRREAFKSVGEPLDFTDEQIFASNYPLIQEGQTVDWRDLIFRDGFMQNYQIGVAGGSEKTTYSLSGDYINERGIMKMDNYDRYLLRATVDHKMNQWISLGTSLQYSHANKDRRGNPLNQANKMPPYAVPFNEDGSIKYQPFGDPQIVSPLGDEIPGAYVNENVTRRVLTNSYLQIKPVDFLTFKSTISLLYDDSRTGFFAASQSLARSNQRSQATYDETKYAQYQWENTVTFDKTLGAHSFQILGGSSALQRKTEKYNIQALDVTVDNMRFYNFAATNLNERVINSSYTQSQLLSFFGRLNYSFLDRYLLTLVYRADGASQLAPGNKWQSFPSAAVAWKVHEEAFMKSQNVLSFLKFRGSYGISGNSAVAPYQTDSRLGQTMYSWDETTPAPGWYLRTMAAEDLGWETTSTFNLGVDFGFLEDRVTLTLERYYQHTTDLLLEKKLPYALGYYSITDNVGETKNSGYEVLLSSTNVNTRNVKWTTDITFSANKERIIKLADSTTRDIDNGWFVGHPVDVHFDYDKIGIWQLGEEEAAAQFKGSLGPGEIKVRDADGDSIQTESDKVVLGNPRPKWTLGVNNRVEFMGFDFTIFVFARIGQMIDSELHSRFDRAAGGVSYKADYWTEDNPTNAYPKPSRISSNRDLGSTLGYVDGSFVKIRNMSLGYTIPRKITDRAGISQLRVYSTMKNYFTFSELAPYDPERGGSASYPMTKQWIFGLNLTF